MLPLPQYVVAVAEISKRSACQRGKKIGADSAPFLTIASSDEANGAGSGAKASTRACIKIGRALLRHAIL
jgi:hypothetical protein